MSKLLVGCCSWADKSLIDSGKFYPPDARSAEERLRYYAGQFPIVEVDSTFYGLPEETTVRHWIARTPDEFTFNVKAFRAFTGHQMPPKVLAKEHRELLGEDQQEAKTLYYDKLPQELRDELWRTFNDRLLALDSAGKLGAVVFQFPPWFTYARDNFRLIAHCREMLPLQFAMAVEFRNALWLAEDTRERTLGFLRENRLALVAVDEPQGFPSSVPSLTEVTSDKLAMVRFHGRNAETWAASTRTSAERFDWYYKDEELEDWLPRIENLAEQASEVHLMMNTNRYDQGPVNAHKLGQILRERGLEMDESPWGQQLGLALEVPVGQEDR
jgi:uncharacterized protein YecE (DUF72 family)